MGDTRLIGLRSGHHGTMPVNWSMFSRRADQDPQASGKTGLAKMLAGWRLMLRDDRDALAGRTSRKRWWSDRKRLRDG